MTFFHEEGFWEQRGIASSLEEKDAHVIEQDPDLQRLRDRPPAQTQTGATSGAEMRDAPPSEEED